MAAQPNSARKLTTHAASAPSRGLSAARYDHAHPPTVETIGLTKRYGGGTVAVDNLNLRLYPGEVYGFLGPNGAGKTTTLRMLLGLSRATSGQARVLGAAAGSRASLVRVGALVESAAFYRYLSGRDNLWVLARHAGVGEERINVVLAQVGLTDRAGDAFNTYSLGMKQRLGVAAALLKDPDLLILDEPTNGLDPAGIADMRRLIRSLASGDRTVLLSSHLMAEVEQTCDRVGIILRGLLVAEGTIDKLRGQDRLELRVEPLETAERVIAGLPGVGGVSAVDELLRVSIDTERAAEVVRALVGAGVAVSEVKADRASLEQIFLELTEDAGSNHVE